MEEGPSRVTGPNLIKVAALAGQDIEAGVRSPVITVDTPVDVSTVFWREERATRVEDGLEITVEDGTLTSAAQPNTWMRHVQLSGNCHAQNLEIAYDSKGNLFLQTVRVIAKSEPLYAWFSMETSKSFNIPFLGLKNIQGHQQYRCHHCDVTYQNPNPLKIHLAFFCTAADLIENHNHLQVPTFQPSLLQSLASYSTIRSTTPQNLVSQTRIQSFDHLGSRYGLFGPIPQPPVFPLSFGHFGVSELNFAPTFNSQMLIDSLRPSCGPPQTLLPAASKTFVYEPLSFDSKVTPSNDQTSCDPCRSDVRSECRLKRRHKCYYCGKMYSRKYGLKIHIRTHTGYKPLKCKVCLRPFGDPSNLNKHIRLHAEGTTPYRCHLCGKVLVRRRDLERHLKSRHPSETRDKSKTEKDNDESHTQTTKDQ